MSGLKGLKCILYSGKVKSYLAFWWQLYFASPHHAYSPHMYTTQISQTWSVKTLTYLIITWAFSSGPLTGSKSLSLSDFLSLLRLSNAAISSHFALQVQQARPRCWLAPFISVTYLFSTAGGSEFCTIGVNIEPWTDDRQVINPPSVRRRGQIFSQEQKNPKQKPGSGFQSISVTVLPCGQRTETPRGEVF